MFEWGAWIVESCEWESDASAAPPSDASAPLVKPAAACAADTSAFFEDVWRRCLSAGARPTSHKRALVEALCAHPEPRSADQRRTLIELRGRRMTLSATYRSLNDLEKINVVTRWDNGRGKAWFNLTGANFTICFRSAHGSEIATLHEPDIEQRLRELAKDRGLSVRRIEIMLTVAPMIS